MRVAVIAPDNAGRLHWPPLGLMYLTAALEEAGHETFRIHQDIHHLTPAECARRIMHGAAEVVAMSWIAGPVPHRNALALAEAIPDDVPIVAGGHGPSGGAAWYRAHLRDGVNVEVVEGYGRSEVLGISADIRPDSIATPRLLVGWPVDYYALAPPPRGRPTDRTWTVLAGRGCPGRCTFCYRLEPHWHRRDLESLRAEVRYLKSVRHITYIQLQDECALGTRQRAEDLAETMAACGVRWSSQGRVTAFAEGAELAQTLARAGCVFVNLGLESLSAPALRAMGKKHSPAEAEAAVRYLREAGISVGLNFIWPLPGDSLESLNAAVDFILAWTDDAQLRTIRPPSPWPGCELWDRAIEAGVWRDVGHFYETFGNSDLASISYIDGLSPQGVNRALFGANKRLLLGYHQRALAETMDQCEQLYLGGDKGFRGWRQV